MPHSNAADALKGFTESEEGIALLQGDAQLAADWEGIVNFSKNTASLEDFFDRIALQKPEDHFEFNVEKVSLMTLHASKGLEFPVVFITGCEEGLLPLSLAGMQSDPEEERRLFYVGMTRAKQYLYQTNTHKRFLYGHAYQNRQSRFLSDIQEDLKAYEQMKQKARRETSKEDDQQLTLF